MLPTTSKDFYFLKSNAFCFVGPMTATIDDSLQLYYEDLKKAFSRIWAKHKCDKPGCKWCLVTDGGLKVNSYLKKLAPCSNFVNHKFL